jgi:uncharacterized protein YdiU (UPF0061 family)
MPVSAAYRPDPEFMRLGEDFADPVRPAEFPASILRVRGQRHAESVGLGDLDGEEWLAAFARFEPLPANQPAPLALRYHGHQFRVYNPDLGDGRGFLYGQLRDGRGRLLDLGTKGSGRTPWSRTADGRLTLKGAVREALATAMLEAQGVPTSKTLSVVETGEALERGDEPSPTRSAVLTRLSHSHIRFGTFQRLAYLERTDLLGALVDHVCRLYAPEAGEGAMDARVGALLRVVVDRTARLCARWMAAGFVHGVLNTDNMNINGESFDYGPYRFLPRNDPNFVAAYFDHAGLYAFGRQPSAVFWNLQQLAGALLPLATEGMLIPALEAFQPQYRRELALAMIERLGLETAGAEMDAALAGLAFRALAAGGETLRWEPFFFDWRGGEASAGRALHGPRGRLYETEPFTAFRAGLAGHAPARPAALDDAYFARAEPCELLYEEIERIWAAIAADDDWGPLTIKLDDIEAARTATGAGADAPEASQP